MALRFALLIISLTHADALKLLQTSRGQLPPGGEAKKCEAVQAFEAPVSSPACVLVNEAVPALAHPVAAGTPCKVALDPLIQVYADGVATLAAATAEEVGAAGVALAAAQTALADVAGSCCRSSGYHTRVGVTGACGGFGITGGTGAVIFYNKLVLDTEPAEDKGEGDCIFSDGTAAQVIYRKTLLEATGMTGNGAFDAEIDKVCTDGNDMITGVTNAMVLATYAKICGAPCTYFAKAGTMCQVCAGYVLADPAALCTTPAFYTPGVCALTANTGGDTTVAFAGGSMAKAFNDPRVTNMLGETFDIMAVGTMSMLHASAPDSTMPALSIAATIDRAGTRCGATYIQNISVDGSWIQEKLDSPSLQIRAAAVVAKAQSLQVSLDGSTWAHPMEMNVWKKYGESVTVRPQRFQLKVKSVIIDITTDSHRVVEVSAKTRRFANFLNLDVRGINTLSNTAGLQVTGLLSADAHEDAAKLPPGCEEDSYTAQGRKLLSRISA